MRIGFLSPSKKEKFIERLGITEYFYEESLQKTAEFIAKGHELLITADKGSVSEEMALQYMDNEGKKVIGIIPQDDKEIGISHLNLDIFDEIINCGKWTDQPARIINESDILLVFGLSPGVLIEICYTKWFKVNNVYVIKEFIDEELPVVLEQELNITYITLEELGRMQ